MTTAISSRRSGRRDPPAEDNSGSRRKKRKWRHWRASRQKAKLRWLPACPPPGRDVLAASMATQRTGSRSPNLRLPSYLLNQLFHDSSIGREFPFSASTKKASRNNRGREVLRYK